MAIEVGTFTKSTSSGNQQVTLNDSGLTPVALILFGSTNTSETQNTGAGGKFFGVSDGTNDYCVASYGDDGSDNAGSVGDAKVAIIGSATTTTECDGTVSAFAAGSFTINWGSTGSANKIHYIAIGGGISAKVGTISMPGSTGAFNTTGVGFQPEFLIVAGTTTGGIAGTWGSKGTSSIGFTDGTNQGAWYAHLPNKELNTHQLTSAIYGSAEKNGEDYRAAFSAFISDGFTLNPSAVGYGAHTAFYLALASDTDDLNAAVGSFSSTNSGSSSAISGLGFEPQAYYLQSWDLASSTSIQTNHSLCQGASDGTREASLYQLHTRITAKQYDSQITSTKVLQLMGADVGSPVEEADHSSMDSGGFTISWSTSDSTQREILYFALEVSGSFKASTRTYTVTTVDAAIKRALQLDATTQTYAVSGVANAFDRNFHVDATTQTYAITGVDAAFKNDYALSCETVAYSVSGVGADLQRALQAQAESTSYAVTGIDVDLDRGFGLDASTQTYAVTGVDVAFDFTAGYTLEAVTATYAVSGIAADLDFIYEFSAETASYAVSGVDALPYAPWFADADHFTVDENEADNHTADGWHSHPQIGFELDASTQTYVVTAVDVDLDHAYSLDAETAAYSVSGVASSITADFQLDAETQTFDITGVNANLNAADQFPANTQTYAFSGVDANFQRELIFSADTQSYSISGVAADLDHGYYIGLDSEAYSVTWADADLTAARELAASTQTYAVSGQDAAIESSFRLPAESVSYSVAAVAADLDREYHVDFETGTYTASGVDAELDRAAYLSAETSAYSVGGVAADIEAARLLEAAAQSYQVDGGDTGLWKVSEYPANVTTYAVSGTAAFQRALQFEAEVALFAVSGVSATLGKGYGLDAETGDFTVAGVEPYLDYNPPTGRRVFIVT